MLSVSLVIYYSHVLLQGLVKQCFHAVQPSLLLEVIPKSLNFMLSVLKTRFCIGVGTGSIIIGLSYIFSSSLFWLSMNNCQSFTGQILFAIGLIFRGYFYGINIYGLYLFFHKKESCLIENI